MSYVCESCGKNRQKAHKVSHSNIKTRKFQEPNLQEVRASVNGRTVRVRVCTRCIRSGKITKAA
ncbi:MAG: 50S ribosomal protein L28 [Polyangiales bacterium]